MNEIFILFVLMLVNGFFSMAEIALVSARKARLEAQANKGDLRAKKALLLSQKPDSFLSTVQIGITTIGILTGIYSGDNIVDYVSAYFDTIPFLASHSIGLATLVVVIIITFFSLVF